MYWWIYEHPELTKNDGAGGIVIEITPHMVCPETKRIEKFSFLNTKMEFWVELMIPIMDEYEGKTFPSVMHDWELDCGGDTWHEAVENLYNNVLKKYGDYDNSPKELSEEELAEMEEFMSSINRVIVETPKELNEFEIDLIEGHIEDAKATIQALEKQKLGKYADKVMLQKCIDEMHEEIKQYKKDLK